jgi:spermidine synthase
VAIGGSVAVFAVLLIFARPPWNQALLSSGVSFLSLPKALSASSSRFETALGNTAVNKLLFYREGLNTTVSVQENSKEGIIYLKNDGKVEAALPLNKSTAASDLATHVLLGQMPQVFHSGKCSNLFVVGLGSGATCGAALENPEVEHLRVAEIEPTVYEAQQFFQSINGDPLRTAWRRSGRVLACSDDARTLLQFSDTKYDIIISQPAEPWISGSADLYSQEFWNLGRHRLQDDGVFCQWIQLYSIDEQCLAVLCRTFQTIFPQTYIIHYPGAGEIILVGLNRPTTALLWQQNWQRLSAKLPFLKKFLPSQSSLADCIVLAPEQLKDRCGLLASRFGSQLNTDDNLLSEYILPGQLYSFGDTIETNLQALGVNTWHARP